MGFLRRYALTIVIVLVAITLLLTVKDLVDLGSNQAGLRTVSRSLAANVNAQVSNRAANVRTWCGAINQGRDYDRAFVAHVTHGRAHYQLADLNCQAIVAKTLKSAHHK